MSDILQTGVHPGPPARLPGALAIFRAQLRLLLWRKRRGVWIALAIVLAQILAAGTAGIIFGVRIEGGHEEEGAQVMWSRVSEFADELEFPFDEGVAAMSVAAIAALLWGLFWPFRVWSEETPRRRRYHWAMPVDRRRHDLLRAAAGLAALVAIVGLLAAFAAATVALAGHGGVVSTFGPLFWVDLVAAPVVVYLLVSIPVVGSRHPAAWLWGTLGAVAALASALNAWGFAPLQRLLRELLVGPVGLLTALGRPMVAEIAGWGASPAGSWIAAWLVWLLAAAAAVLVAASRRHRSI